MQSMSFQVSGKAFSLVEERLTFLQSLEVCQSKLLDIKSVNKSLLLEKLRDVTSKMQFIIKGCDDTGKRCFNLLIKNLKKFEKTSVSHTVSRICSGDDLYNEKFYAICENKELTKINSTSYIIHLIYLIPVFLFLIVVFVFWKKYQAKRRRSNNSILRRENVSLFDY